MSRRPATVRTKTLVSTPRRAFAQRGVALKRDSYCGFDGVSGPTLRFGDMVGAVTIPGAQLKPVADGEQLIFSGAGFMDVNVPRLC